MTNFLKQIVAEKRGEFAGSANKRSTARLKASAEARREHRGSFRLKAAMKNKDRYNIIAEIKRASPSKNAIDLNVNAASRATLYEANGAAAVSILTEPRYFKGSLNDIVSARENVTLPILRKDFIVNELQILEAAAAGADAVLLIVAALEPDEFLGLAHAADSLGLDALVEVHNIEELEIAERIGATIIGVNNRDLDTLKVDIGTSFALAASKPADCIFVAESGISRSADIESLYAAGFDAFLIGEALMTAVDPAKELRKFCDKGEQDG